MADDVPAGAESVDVYRDVYDNAVVSATPNPLITDPDDIDEQFATDANHALSDAVELLRRLIPSHQSAAAIIVQEDWSSIRKFFSLSSMLQLSDRLTGEYTARDEAALVRFTDLLALTLESLWSLRNARKAAREKFARQSVISSVISSTMYVPPCSRRAHVMDGART